MRKKEWFVLIACIFCIACSALFSFGEECSFIRENTLRLHILANSDSPADQALKLKIRDAVLSCSGELFSGCDTRQKMISAAQEQLPKIQQVAEQTALHNGYELPVTVSVTDMFFETRRYDHVILPAGTYTAVRIDLGAAAGKNWRALSAFVRQRSADRFYRGGGADQRQSSSAGRAPPLSGAPCGSGMVGNPLPLG